MRNLSVASVILFFILACVAPSVALSEGKAEASEMDQDLATWIWNTRDIETKPEEVLQFMEEKQVSDAYLQINRSIALSSYRSFIEQATAKGIRVHALDGAPNWATIKGATYQSNLFNWLESYQANASDYQKFSGVHLDIEPYLHSGWTNNYQNTIAFYQDRLSNAKARTESLGIMFGVDTPFWFDEQSYQNRYGSGNLAEWIIQTVDVTTLMAYRDRADGGNGIIALVRNEIAFAQQHHTKVSIGVETGQTSEASYISFFEEGEAIMNDELLKIKTAYENSTAVDGFSIHYLDSWMALKP
ncbi:amidase [Pseudalkalibacillus hwajinpoensis]|uniref:amidase n=1 Tax=Guptibacillus hwajinpoensis TaxID=208199 RepID=UPI001CFC97D5|nr:amidase [Pseudalkalibacillus hwajinpoensis]